MATSAQRNYRLALKTELNEGQTLMSFVSAMASRNGLRSSASFCAAFDLDLAGLKAGRWEALAKLSILVAISSDRLSTAAHLGRSRANLVGHAVDAIDLTGTVRVCLHCLADDHAAHPKVRFETAAYFRGSWSHALVRSCAVHGYLLTPIDAGRAISDPRHDFAAALRDLAAHTGLPEAIIRHPLPVERYIQNRMTGQATHVPLLDDMDLGDAMFLCRFLGAAHRQGHRPVPPANLDERLEWTNRGFLIAAKGIDAVEVRLEEVARIVNPHGAAEIGLRRVFMDLFDRLHRKRGQDMLSIRQILIEVGVALNLIAFEQTELLGLPVPRRSRQTIESATKTFGVSDRELRAALIQLNAIPHDDAKKPGSTVLFEVGPVSDILSRLRSSLNLVEAARLLGLHTQQLIRICDARLLEPFFTRPSADLKPLRYFERSAVERFLAQLTANCQKLRGAGDIVDVWEAGLKTCRQPIDIIAAIHDGRIQRTYRRGASANVRNLLVDLEDVRNCVFEQSDDLVSAEDCSRILTINITAMRVIMQRGILTSDHGINPVNRRLQLSARREVLEAFNREYISLNGLSQQYGLSTTGMAQTLFRCGVRPAFPPEQSVVRIYIRASVRQVHRKIDQLICHREARKPTGWQARRRPAAQITP